MKEMKYENSFLIFILINFSVKAQNTSSPFLMRATLGASGSSETVTFDNLNFIIQQSIDQSSGLQFRMKKQELNLLNRQW